MTENQLRALVEHGAFTRLKIMKVLRPWVYPSGLSKENESNLNIEDYKDAIAEIIKILYFDEDLDDLLA